MKIAVVLPAYNEAKRIASVLESIPASVGEHSIVAVVVDDGSRDATAEVAGRVKGVTVVRHRTNLGKGAAAKTGCDAACRLNADIIVLMDADGQHRSSDIERMVEPLLKKKRGLVIGTRKIGGSMPLMMRLGNYTLSAIAKILFGITARDTQSGFRAFSREVYPFIRWASSNYAMETEMLILAAHHEIPTFEVGIETIYLDNYKGTTVLDGLRIMKTLLKWKVLWSQESKSLEHFSV